MLSQQLSVCFISLYSSLECCIYTCLNLENLAYVQIQLLLYLTYSQRALAF
jgi:hypothetical protein